jgi:hypothetical protein
MRDERSRDDCLDCFVTIEKSPGRDRPVRATHAQAGVLTQIVDPLRPHPRAEITGAANDYEGERPRQPHGHHVGRDELAETDPGVEAARRKTTISSLAAISTSISG